MKDSNNLIKINNNNNIQNLITINEIQNPSQPQPQIIDDREVLPKISLKNLNYPDITKRLVILDIITTGEDPTKNNIIEIGCYEMINGSSTGRQFHGFLHPRFDIDEYAEQKLSNNIYYDFIKDPKESDCIVLENFLDFINDSKIIVHNIELKMIFINNELAYHKKEKLQKEIFYCTLDIFNQMFPDINTKVKLNELSILSEKSLDKIRKKKIKITDNICSLLKCCEYLKIKIPNKTHFSAKFNSFLISKLMTKIFLVIFKVKQLHIKIKEKLLQKKISNKNKEIE